MTWAAVTGGSRGIGRAASLALAHAGHDVAFTYRSNASEARVVCDQISGLGRRVRPEQLDLADGLAVTRWAQSTAEQLSPQVLVACAAETFRGDLSAHTPDVVRRLLDVNVVATIEMARAFAPALAASGDGSLITVASMNGLRGSASSVAYSSTKAAVLGLTKALAVELAPAVRVNALVPGIVETAMNAEALADPATASAVARSIPLGRLGTPDEVGAVIAWLAGAGAAYLTGSVLTVDGGALAMFPVH
ncbi:SDR family NAD(P)-dependent oxidoreductase [Embleya scabrispora]|uniref:SDR family NAD(P)-dependent oxidoreductase n=1 Tax=Embleya scabrispora TaxID=159449 RepID=UPI000592FACC|nr:SDR family oxidoreductase [Embleya scabrispora]MYS85121.1 SDR family oxidoreductase [Streptomyces sp. SID5474]